MKLIIDDCPRRRAAFRRAFGSSIREAESFLVASAILTATDDGDLSEIYLDHDGVDGERIAVRIVAMQLHKSARFLIHSSNYCGSIKMRDILAAGGYDVLMVRFEDVIGRPSSRAS